MSGALAVVPVKPLARALGRLRGTLSGPERQALQKAMLCDVLAACRRAAGVEGVLVVTADSAVATLARSEAAVVVPESPRAPGLNGAVCEGLWAAARRGAEAALVVMADLPLVGPWDIEALLRAAPARGVALAPSRDGTGTNALLLRPPGALAPQLGPGSLARHRAQAARRDLPAVLCPVAGLALDVDTPGDLAALFRADAPAGASGAWCARAAPPVRVAVGGLS